LVKLPRDVTGDQAVRALKKKGWFIVRIKGSHHHLSHNDYKTIITIPCHPKPLYPKIIHIIIKLAKLTPEEFIELL